jgi:hypothetical protein
VWYVILLLVPQLASINEVMLAEIVNGKGCSLFSRRFWHV